MPYPTLLLALLQPEFIADVERLADIVRDVIREQEEQLIGIVIGLVRGEVTPVAMMEFEVALATTLRELGRRLTEESVNRIEPEDAAQLPEWLTINGDSHTPNSTKTPHKHTLAFFGEITLWRFGWRTPDHTGETVFPLEEALGLIRGCTPALAERAAWLAGNASNVCVRYGKNSRSDWTLCVGNNRPVELPLSSLRRRRRADAVVRFWPWGAME